MLFPYDPVHQTFINIYEQDTLRHQSILSLDRPSFDYYAGSVQGTWAVIRTFVSAGIEHILIGPDHVLFLVGLLLLGGSLKTLVTIVTAFTIGHSVTLSLAALDLFSPPARIIEPAIALSIVFVGADNLLVRRAQAPRDIRAFVAAVFGLVHGFGFAARIKGIRAARRRRSAGRCFRLILGSRSGSLALFWSSRPRSRPFAAEIRSRETGWRSQAR